MTAAQKSYGDDRREDALLLIGLAEDARQPIDLGRMLDRPAGSASRRSLLYAMDEGWVDGRGRITLAGSLACAAWRRS